MSEMHIPSITCIQYIHYMYIVCTLQCYMYMFFLNVCYTYTICILHACYVLYVSYMYPICIYANICVAASGAFFGLGVLLGLSYGAPKLGCYDGSSVAVNDGKHVENMGNMWENMGFTHQQVGILDFTNEYHKMMDNLIYNGKTTSPNGAFMKI